MKNPFHSFGKNKILEDSIQKVEMNMSNNYKDAAQANFKELEKVYAELCSNGKLKEKHRIAYGAKIEALRVRLQNFTHKDQKPYWT